MVRARTAGQWSRMSSEAVLRTGEHGAEMFFITEGECEVVVDGVQVAIIGHAAFFQNFVEVKMTSCQMLWKEVSRATAVLEA